MQKRTWLIIGIIISTAVILLSYYKTENLGIRTDYYVFYQAGENFEAGNSLYNYNDDVRPYLYPPFAAFLFQVLSILPLSLSAYIFSLFNFFILLPLTFWILLKTLRNFGFSERAKTALILSTISAAHFFWSNFSMLQVNFFVFTICCTGIYFYSKNLFHYSAVCFVLASFIKVFPVFFLIFVVIKHIKSGKVLLYTTSILILCLMVSILPRGIETGINDHFSYYNVFLKEFQEGRVITTNSNHTLKALILKAFYPATRNVVIDASLYEKAMLIANIFLLILFAATTFVSVRSARSKMGVNNLIIFSLIFIFTHLVSGITWTAHLVTMMFSYLPLFLINPKNIKSKTHSFIHYIFWGIAFFLAIEGKDTTGTWLYNMLSFYDVFVIFPLILFLYYIYLLFYRSHLFEMKIQSDNEVSKAY